MIPSVTRGVPAWSWCGRTPLKPCRSSSSATSGALGAAVLEQQPAARLEMRGGACGDRRQRFETRRAAAERELGFGSQGLERGICGRDIGRIGNHHIEALAAHRIEPGSEAPGDLRQREGARVVPGHAKGRRRDIGAGDSGSGPLRGDRESDGAAAGAQIEDRALLIRRQTLQCELDQCFGFRPRYEHRGRDLERQRPEFAGAGQIGDRRARDAPLDEA